MYEYRKSIRVLAGVRRVDDIGPKGGTRRRFQTWIERRDEANWHPDARHIEMHSGAIYGRQYLAAQNARFAAEQCRALETIFRAFA